MKTAIFPQQVAPHHGRTERVGVFRKFNIADRLPLIDALERVRRFNLEHGTSATIITPKAADIVLSEPALGFSFAPSPLLTNSIIAYEAPEQRLGKEIVYADKEHPRVILPTGRYAGASGIALVAISLTPTDFRLDVRREDGINDLWLDICDDRLMAVENFPAQNGWYVPDAKTGVPAGDRRVDSDAARDLWRIPGPIIGPVFRDIDERTVLVMHDLFYRAGVVIDIPRNDFEKVKHLNDSFP